MNFGKFADHHEIASDLHEHRRGTFQSRVGVVRDRRRAVQRLQG